MITIAVAAILLMIGIPSFQNAINSSRLNGAANELLADLMFARTSAISQGQRVGVCASNNQTTCTNTSWRDGWIVFDDLNRNDQVDAATETVIRVHQALPNNFVATTAGLRVSALGGPMVSLLPSGTVLGIAGNIQFCLPTTQPNTNVRRLTVAAPAGRMQVTSETSAVPGVCP
jgi:type IV fimbrial biogenesis protein FimT